MNPKTLLALLLASTSCAFAELRVPASTAYLDPDPNGAKVSKTGITDWKDPKISVSWFGEIKSPGKLKASLVLHLPKDARTRLRLTVEKQSRDASASGASGALTVDFGEFTVAQPCYVRFQLTSLNPSGRPAGDLDALVLDGPAMQDAHFNLDPRRNAASVHLQYPIPADAEVALFYNEVTGVTDPVATYYMACGFARGYFGMQVNSEKERRIIFSVWDSGAGQTAMKRSDVPDENRVKLLAKGDGVVASDFGNEGTGGHSHLVYAWKTGQPQKFVVTAKAEGDLTIYTGYWFHPEQRQWKLIASFRAPNDGKWLRGLYSFSENFNGNNGHVPRKALFGPQWIQTKDGKWQEITEASFSHDGTGKENRLDRFMGVENGRFFLAHGGFVPGFTQSGEKFTRPATGRPPELQLPVPRAN
jgi:heme-degrading monooxygenase HmoA